MRGQPGRDGARSSFSGGGGGATVAATTKEDDGAGQLVCLASDAVGMVGRSLPMSDNDAPLCAALAASRTIDAPPLLVDLGHAAARAEVEGRYGLKVRSVLFVPVVATSTSPSEDLQARYQCFSFTNSFSLLSFSLSLEKFMNWHVRLV